MLLLCFRNSNHVNTSTFVSRGPPCLPAEQGLSMTEGRLGFLRNSTEEPAIPTPPPIRAEHP